MPRPSSRTSPRTGSKVLSQYGSPLQLTMTHIWKHLVPFFGEYSMKDLNPEMIQQFVSASAVSPKTTKILHHTPEHVDHSRAWG